MEEGLNKPLISQRCLQIDVLFFLTRAPRSLSRFALALALALAHYPINEKKNRGTSVYRL